MKKDAAIRKELPPTSPLAEASVDADLLIALFFFAWRGFAAEPDAILEREGLGRVHHRVLYTVVRVPGIRVGDLADNLGITRQALHRPLTDLVREEFIVSTVSKESARERELRATPRGVRLDDQASGAQRRQLQLVFAALGQEATAGWTKVMQALASPLLSESSGHIANVLRTHLATTPSMKKERQ